MVESDRGKADPTLEFAPEPQLGSSTSKGMAGRSLELSRVGRVLPDLLGNQRTTRSPLIIEWLSCRSRSCHIRPKISSLSHRMALLVVVSGKGWLDRNRYSNHAISNRVYAYRYVDGG